MILLNNYMIMRNLLRVLFLYAMLTFSLGEQVDDAAHKEDFISFDKNGDQRVDPSEVRR